MARFSSWRLSLLSWTETTTPKFWSIPEAFINYCELDFHNVTISIVSIYANDLEEAKTNGGRNYKIDEVSITDVMAMFKKIIEFLRATNG